MPAYLQFDVFGEPAINRELQGVYDRVNDWRPAFLKLRTRFHDMEKQQFETQGASGGEKWAQLSAARVQAKARSRNPSLSSSIMVATGRLRQSLTVLGAKGAVSRMTRTKFYIGTTVPYGQFHQKGTSGGGVKRKVISFLEPEKRLWVKELQMHLHAEGLLR